MDLISFLLVVAIQAAGGGEGRQPYVIQLKDGEVVGFWNERGIQSGGVVRVELDMPWRKPDRQWKMIPMNTVVGEPVEERESATAQRRQKGYADAGLVALANGMVVAKDKYDLAQRARQLAGLNAGEGEEDTGADGAEGEQDAGEVEAAAAPPVGFFERWGAHIGLLLVAVLLTGLVVRMAFLSGD